MEVCIILNVLIMLAYAGEMWIDYGVILDEDIKLNQKSVYIIRLVAITLITGLALLYLYKSFGINDSNLYYYIKYGKIK
jgi:hypothetical protein